MRSGHPKALAVANLVAEYGEGLMADFRRFYGYGLGFALDYFHPNELFAMIRWLPEDSVFKGLVQGGEEHVGWTYERVMQTLQLEAQMFHNYEFRLANVDRPSKAGPAPKELHIPGREFERRKQSLANTPLAALMAEQKKKLAEQG